MPKRTKPMPKASAKIDKEVLHALTQTLNNGDVQDEVFHRLKKKVLTKDRINSVCAALDRIKDDNPQSYLYYVGYFLSIYDRHKALEQKLELERIKIDMQKIQLQNALDMTDNNEETEENLISQMYSVE